MSSVGSFGTFTTARLAIYTSQKGLSVTGNNIANINTIGYTRQRLDQVSFKTGGSDRYQSQFDKRVGNGAIPQAVSQLRDPYLDIRYRAEASSAGFYDGWLGGLNQLESILDETGLGKKDGDGLLYAQFSDFFDALKHIETGAGTEVNDTLAYTSADALCALFQSAAQQLDRLKGNTENQLRQEVNDINSILTSIRGLNETIQQAEIYGDNALELRDQRNLFIDELSEKLKIDVTYSMVDIGLGKEVEKLTIRLGNANPDISVDSDSSILVDGNYCAQLTTPKANDKYDKAYEVYDTSSQAYKDALAELEKNKTYTLPVPAPGTVLNVPAGKTARKVLDEAIEEFLDDDSFPDEYYRYVDENGQLTNDPREAEQVFDDHYNITVSDLRDKNYKEWVDYGDTRSVSISDQKAQDDGFPTRAYHTENFTFSGVWKDGDTITANGVTVKIGPAQNPAEANTVYLSANDANADPKNVSNTVREALLESYRAANNGTSPYNVNTKTTKNPNGTYNVEVKVTAKEPGTRDEPDVDIEMDSANQTPFAPGDAAIPAPTQTANAGEYSAAVTVTKENIGDTITYGNVTLVVGKDITAAAASNPKTLASTLANKLKVNGFTVTSTSDKDGNVSLIFKANDPDNINQAALPTADATVTPPTNASFKSNNDGVGADGDTPMMAPPNQTTPRVDLNPPPKVVDNGDNTISSESTIYYMDDEGHWHSSSVITRTSKTKQLDDNDLFGKLQAVRELLSEEGEFSSVDDIAMDESAAIKRGIPFYQQTLDLLARKFAETMNEANNGFAVDQNGNYLKLAADGESFEQIELPAETDLNDAALSNYIKANFDRLVEDADGQETILADKYGNPLTVGGTVLTTENVKIGTATLKDLGFKTINADGMLAEENGTAIGMTQDAGGNDVQGKVEFKMAAGDALDAATAAVNAQALNSYLSVNGGVKPGGNLFSNRGDTDDATGITASNISVSQSWTKGDVHVVPTYTKLFGGEVSNTTKQDNALHMSNLINRDLVYNPQDLVGDAFSSHLFEGSFQKLFVKMNTTLGNDKRSTQTSLETHMGQALDIDTSRDAVSAVDLNDEAMDLMQYTHSLNAAYRLMTTLDEMLERLITGTGVTR